MEMKDLAFEDWVRLNFDRPVASPAWYWNPEADTWEEEPALSIAYITRAFEESARVFAPFSDAQLDQGLWHLINESGEIGYLFAESVTEGDKLRCARSIFALFERCFAIRCSNSLLHRDEKASPLNSVCYMWWDIFPTWGAPDSPARHALDSELLRVMQKTLALDSAACRESALHGLSHWHLHYPRVVEATIDAFLAGRPKLSRHLQNYARDARNGAVQ